MDLIINGFNNKWILIINGFNNKWILIINIKIHDSIKL